MLLSMECMLACPQVHLTHISVVILAIIIGPVLHVYMYTM